MKMKTLLPKVGGVATLLIGLWMAITDPGGKYLTPWLAVLWGVMGAIGLLLIEVKDGKLRHRLPPLAQLFCALVMILATVVASNWAHWGKRDLLQWVYTAFLVSIFKDGFRWALSRNSDQTQH